MAFHRALGDHQPVGDLGVGQARRDQRQDLGVRLVAARELGILRRWRAAPLPRWCYFPADRRHLGVRDAGGPGDPGSPACCSPASR